MEPPSKRARLLSDDSASDSDSDNGSANVTAGSKNGDDATLKINSDFAKRFQHNQQRAERHRLEEKYGKGSASGSDSDSDSESEDDDGELVTEELDHEILDTLKAIRSKDPRVYDKQATFYNSDPLASNDAAAKPKEKPVHLRDYHRKNLLQDAGELPAEEHAPTTYADEQSALKHQLLNQMHKLPEGEASDGDEDGDFLVRKPGQKVEAVKSRPPQDLDVAMADRDPETYLSNFMASRAWVPTAASKYQPFESDDEEEDERADAFEAAYNMRFENPEHANEKLVSHSREAAAQYSVRREDAKGRKKAREDEKARRDAEKKQREEEKARLRRLKIEEAQEKWLRLKEAAGLKKQHLSDEKLLKFLEHGFEGEEWDRQMAQFLGESYYDDEEDEDLNGYEGGSGDDETEDVSRKLPIKPKWDDDIDIGDIVPEFNEVEERQRANIRLSDDDYEHGDDEETQNIDDQDETNDIEVNKLKSSKKQPKDAKKARDTAKRDARIARQKIEAMVDNQLATSIDAPSAALFRYRETSPNTHGLTSLDILMADDSQLNQFAGLKKLATYRDDEKKARDRRKLGKKARLRQWRKDTFGDERGGASKSFEDFINEGRIAPGAEQGVGNARQIKAAAAAAAEGDVRGETGEKRKKKRKRSKKSGAVES